jgi:hypothetical protein
MHCTFTDPEILIASTLLRSIAAPQHYDLILSAETLYSTDTLEKVLPYQLLWATNRDLQVFQFIAHHLAYPSGLAIIASKRYSIIFVSANCVDDRTCCGA